MERRRVTQGPVVPASTAPGLRESAPYVAASDLEAHMGTNILLAVDVAAGSPLRHVNAAVEMASELIRDDADHVIVLHVHEFSVARLAWNMHDQGDHQAGVQSTRSCLVCTP